MKTWECYIPENNREAAEASLREYARTVWLVDADTREDANVALIRTIEAEQPLLMELVPPDILAEWFLCVPKDE